MTDSIYIIAEAGVNHNGSQERALEMVDAAAAAGVDAVKFQTFKADQLVSKEAPKAEYQIKTTAADESQYAMIKALELDDQMHRAIIQRCQEKQIQFLSSPFDLESIEYLQSLNMQTWKIPSGEITNLPYLRKIGSLGEEIILSTGMSNIDEVGDALNILEMAGASRSQIILLHCNTEYPTPMADVNLAAMKAMREAFPGLKGVGYSDHTIGLEVSVAAVALGATVIEKHLTLDHTLPGPDHAASLEPDELLAMVKAIRNIEQAIGDGEKKPTASEFKNRGIARKSIVAARPISAGETFTEDNLIAKRPGTGLTPMRWDDFIGQSAVQDYDLDEEITDT